eukprot:TRINITY_DN40689_c0_g1_i2.p1 TRINITY_DN40689_c0_g1~~TRINITY_DN40689_c0_g1_i2.p1  ORF type:complete len:534 (+),score=67.00 TRINITY_DN40689_c0_g1_i2:193-1602(+)
MEHVPASAPGTPLESTARALGLDDDHLLLGLSMVGIVYCLAMIGFDTYDRQAAFLAEGKEDWITKAFGRALTGYDVAVAVRQWLDVNGHRGESAAEVMRELGQESVGAATVFLSHVQVEPLEASLRWVNDSRWCVPGSKLWVDYFVLRQCQKDFNVHFIEIVIVHISNTLAVEDEAQIYLTRSFCILEVAVTPPGALKFPLVPKRSRAVAKRENAERGCTEQPQTNINNSCPGYYFDAEELPGIRGNSCSAYAMSAKEKPSAIGKSCRMEDKRGKRKTYDALDKMSSCDSRAAKTRFKNDKATVDAFIARIGGFGAVDRAVKNAIMKAHFSDPVSPFFFPPLQCGVEENDRKDMHRSLVGAADELGEDFHCQRGADEEIGPEASSVSLDLHKQQRGRGAEERFAWPPIVAPAASLTLPSLRSSSKRAAKQEADVRSLDMYRQSNERWLVRSIGLAQSRRFAPRSQLTSR